MSLTGRGTRAPRTRDTAAWSRIAVPRQVGAREAVPTLGLRQNWRQFWLLVLVNAFVGAMVGLERSTLPLLAQHDFGIASKTAGLSFIATFGIAKAMTNLAAGQLGDRIGRKRILVAGWLAALPVPFIVIWAPAWSWIVVANVLLGVNQGLAWSTTVIMKIDLVGAKQRGLAMGLNEFAGYLAVGLVAVGSAVIASRFGLRPAPYYFGIAFAVLGLTLSLLFVRDTTAHARHEAGLHDAATSAADASAGEASSNLASLPERRGWRTAALVSASQAGLVNNLNDGLAWGLFPLFFAAAGLAVRDIGVLAFVYPAAWGVTQLCTGVLSDRWGRKGFIAGGMVVQATALVAIVFVRGFWPWFASSLVLGVGTAMVYPTLLAAVGDVAHPSSRGRAVGAYRFWRDLGYPVGALLAGVLADAFGMASAIGVVGGLTLVSGIAVMVHMPETLPSARR